LRYFLFLWWSFVRENFFESDNVDVAAAVVVDDVAAVAVVGTVEVMLRQPRKQREIGKK